MRLWSISPHYLDKQGLCGLWREALLGQACLLKGEYTKCSKCLGSGYWSTSGECKEEEKCPKCKGTGKIKTPYWNHPQLKRFKNLDTLLNTDRSIRAIGYYLNIIWHEASKRGYKFDFNKIKVTQSCQEFLTVTKGQIAYEFKHLQEKLFSRDTAKYKENRYTKPILPNSLFKVIDGSVESWEKVK